LAGCSNERANFTNLAQSRSRDVAHPITNLRKPSEYQFPKKETKEKPEKRNKIKKHCLFSVRRTGCQGFARKFRGRRPRNFPQQTAKPPDLYSRRETDYLCSLFYFIGIGIHK
jgi:hypothetical protein